MAASDGAQTRPAGQRPSKGKKERAYGSRRSSGLGLQGKWPVGHPTRGAASDQAEGAAAWPEITAVSGDVAGLTLCSGNSGGQCTSSCC